MEQIIKDYPKASIAPQMLHWLGVQYRDVDVARSVESFTKLKNDFPQAPEAEEALMNIGYTYYKTEKYKKARDAYRQALKDAPELKDTLEPRIKRSIRNIRRVHLYNTGLIIFFSVSMLGLFTKPVGLRGRQVKKVLAALFVLCFINIIAAYLIREQFSSTGEMVKMVFFLSLSAAWAGTIGMTLANKILPAKEGGKFNPAGIAAGIMLSLITYAAGFYLTIYIVYEHYLIIVNT